MAAGPPAKGQEADMSKDINMADVIMHLHPDTTGDDEEKIEKDLRSMKGVVSVHFDTKEHAHALVVAYNPEEVTSDDLLAHVRTCDKDAMMAGL